MFFDPNNLEDFAPPSDIWIEDPKDLDMSSHWIHEQVTEKLAEFIDKPTMPHLLSGYVLESGNGMRYLVLDNPRAGIVKSNLEYTKNFHRRDGFAILDVLNKYNISKVIEKYTKIIKSEDSIMSTGSSREVIGKSMLDKRREDMFFINLARKHGMTNSQYLRLKILAKSLFEAGQQASLDEVARSIVGDADNVNIPIKQLPLEEK